MKKICKQCDKILNAKESNYITKAISSLHVIKIHPDYEKNYFKGTYDVKNKKISNIRLSIKFFKRNFFFLKHLLKKIFFIKNKKEINKKDILIISHCNNKNDLISKKDFYFGNLPLILKKNKLSYINLLINETEQDSEYLNNYNKTKNRIVLEKYMNFFNEVKLFFLQLSEFFRLKKLSIKEKNEKNKFLLNKTCYSIFDSQTKFSLRMFFLMRLYIEKIKPKYLIFTYEGFPWERLSICAAKKYNKGIKCIGYQHTLVSKIHHAMTRNLEKNYNPDIIWASGKNSYNLLSHHKKLKKVKIKNIGTFKTINIYKKKINFKKNCLVIPEGIYSECIKLFDFTLQCSKKSKFLNFIWRVHPVINLNIVLESLKLTSENIPSSIKISKNKSLKLDVINSSHVLYRGSSAVIEAISGGNYPVYLNLDNKINIDPIYSYRKNKTYVNSVDQLLSLVKNPIKVKKIKSIQKYGAKIQQDLYGKLNKKKLLDCLKV